MRLLLARRFHRRITVARRAYVEARPAQDLDVQLLRLSIVVHDEYPCLDFFHEKPVEAGLAICHPCGFQRDVPRPRLK
jgi:hypothetical protein